VPHPNRGGDTLDVKKGGAFSCAVCFSSHRGANERLPAGWHPANGLARRAAALRLNVLRRSVGGDRAASCSRGQQPRTSVTQP
jgi:hypothetical protein